METNVMNIAMNCDEYQKLGPNMEIKTSLCYENCLTFYILEDLF